MSLLSTQAIVLRGFDFSENDRIIVFYTKDFGKIKGFAKGVKKDKSHSAGCLLNLTHCNLTLYKKSDWANINQCEIIDYHPGFYQSDNYCFMGLYLAELVYWGTEEGESNQDIFYLLHFFLKILENKPEDPDSILRMFEIRWLKLLGLFPELSCCIECGNELEKSSRTIGHSKQNQAQIAFSISKGGTFCSDCADKNFHLNISSASINFCKQVLKLDLEKLTRLKLHQESQKELKVLFNRYIEYILNRPINSFSFLEHCYD